MRMLFECALNFSVSTPAVSSISLTHLDVVSFYTGLCGFTKVRNTFPVSWASLYVFVFSIYISSAGTQLLVQIKFSKLYWRVPFPLFKMLVLLIGKHKLYLISPLVLCQVLLVQSLDLELLGLRV